MRNTASGDRGISVQEALCQGIEQADLDAHLACLALTLTFHELQRTPFGRSTEALRSSPPDYFDGSSWRAHDVAVVGLRLALGWEIGQISPDFVTLCTREIGRQPLPPLDTVATDPRLLVGVSAGIAQIGGLSQLEQDLWRLAQQFRAATDVRPWEYVLACWTHRVLARDDKYTRISEDLSRYLLRWETELSRRDRAAIMWTMSHYDLFIPTVTDRELDELNSLGDDLRQVAYRDKQLVNQADALELAFVYDAFDSGICFPNHIQQPVRAVLAVIDAFPRVANRLEKERRKGKEPYTTSDEYDVQDLFYAMLLPALPDLEAEDPTIKDATSSKKIDFVSRRGRVGIEIKHVGNKTQAAKVADELKIDIESYHIHPACRTLLCFVYDPHGYITSSAILERDLTGSRSFNGRPMEVITCIRPR